MRLTLVGPNLPAKLQNQGSIHVHAEGCADLKRGAIRPHAEREGWSGDYKSKTEVCDVIYPPDQFECESGEYLYDIHFAPCCADLPTE